MSAFDPLEPFSNRRVLNELLSKIRKFDFKLYGVKRMALYRGRPTKYEFDLHLGMVHFTEQDFKGLSDIFESVNKKWGTNITFCIYPAKRGRAIIMNVRSPKAPMETD